MSFPNSHEPNDNFRIPGKRSLPPEDEIPAFQSQLTKYSTLHEQWQPPNVLYLKVCPKGQPASGPIHYAETRPVADSPARSSRRFHTALLGVAMLLGAFYFLFLRVTPIEGIPQPGKGSASASMVNQFAPPDGRPGAEMERSARSPGKNRKKVLLFYFLRGLQQATGRS